jgi:enoyl-CoA hydratase/carnithine racemase
MGMLGLQDKAARSLAALRALPVPVIAAVNGAAAGGGFALTLAADIRLASPAARFNAAFVRIGLSAGDLGTSWHLPRLIGSGRAAEIAFTGRFVEAEEAERIGLVNRIVPAETLIDEALALTAQIATHSSGGVQLSKRALQSNLDIPFSAALELENRGQALLTRGEDMPEALQAFKEGRAPVFTGR